MTSVSLWAIFVFVWFPTYTLKLQLFVKTCPFLSTDSSMNLIRWFLLLFPFPGRSQWGGTTFFPERLSLEGASFCFGEGAQCGDTHQVCPLCWPEWTVEDPVCTCWAQHLPEQVWYWMFLLFLHFQTQYVFSVNLLSIYFQKKKKKWLTCHLHLHRRESYLYLEEERCAGSSCSCSRRLVLA